MGRRSKADVMADLDARKIQYTPDDSYEDLVKLLPVEQEKPKVEEKPKKAVPPVTCGVSTINDHERRLCELEDKVFGN